MDTNVSAETLSPVTHNQIPVITTESLAQLYGTEAIRIQQNHKRNDGRFVEGKHFFKVAGDELTKLRLSLSESQNLRVSLRHLQISPKTRSLILWTERGAARHAKMLETDQAWEVFEKLEDCYFSRQTHQPPFTPSNYDSRVLCYQRNGVTISQLPLKDDELVISIESWLQIASKNGWVVIRREELASRLAGAVEQCLLPH